MNIEEIGNEIIKETDALRAKLAKDYKGDPEAELLVWLQVAIQREAMVTYLYDRARTDGRLKGAEGDAVTAVRDVITAMWQQESSHCDGLAPRLINGIFAGRDGVLKAKIAQIKGTVDATMLDLLTEPDGGFKRALARVVAWFGAKVAPGTVPKFATELPKANLREYFLLARALEQTAKDSYKRIADILPDLIKNVNSVQPQTLLVFIKDTARDEGFHERAFEEIATWVDVDGKFVPGLDGKQCIGKLKSIAEKTLGLQSYGARGIPILESDGGLGVVFRKYNVPVLVIGDADVE
jgi:hypothetical protein